MTILLIVIKNLVDCSRNVVDVDGFKRKQQIKLSLNSRKIFFIQQNDFHQQNEFKTEFESMEVNEINKCLSKFYVSVTRKDGSFFNLKIILLSVRATLDHHLKSTPHNKKFLSATTVYLYSEANKGLNRPYHGFRRHFDE